MDPRLAWGSVAAPGLSLAGSVPVAPGRVGSLAISLLGWATLGVAAVVFATGV